MTDFYNLDEVRSELNSLVSKNNFEGNHLCQFLLTYLLTYFNTNNNTIILGARQLYTERIMDWTDYYMENLYDVGEADDIALAIRSICQLWIDFAEMEIEQKQYKKASQIFDKAMDDPIVKTSSSIYLRYSSFCEVINKLGHAKTVLIRGLMTTQLSQANADLLWIELLSITQKSGSPNLTMKLLYDALVLEKGTDSIITKPSEVLLNPIEVDQSQLNPANQETIKLSPSTENITATTATTTAATIVTDTKVPMDTATTTFPSSLAVGGTRKRDYDDVSFLTPEQLTSTFVNRPPMLFNFSDQV